MTVTQLNVTRSEWTKLRSLRSSMFPLIAAVVIVVGLGAIITSVTVANWPPTKPEDLATFDPTMRSLGGVFLAQLAVGALGVLLISSEYATGMIRSSLAAVPARLPVLWGKATVYASVCLALLVPTVLAAFLSGQAILSSKGIQTNLGTDGVLRAVLGSALYLTLVGLLGLSLGALLRNTAAAISTLFGLLFVLPIIVNFLPSSVSGTVGKYLPGSAGRAITQVKPMPDTLSPWAGLMVFALYSLAALIAAAVALQWRDT